MQPWPLQQRLPVLLNGPDNPQKSPIPLEGSASPSNTWFLGSTGVFIQNGISIGSDVFTQLTVVSHYFTMGRYISPKLPIPIGGSSLPCNTWYRGPTRVITPNGTSIGSSVLIWVPNATPLHSQWGKNPEIAASPWVPLTPPEEDQATAIGNMHKNLVEIAFVVRRYARGQTDTHRERQTCSHCSL